MEVQLRAKLLLLHVQQQLLTSHGEYAFSLPKQAFGQYSLTTMTSMLAGGGGPQDVFAEVQLQPYEL